MRNHFALLGLLGAVAISSIGCAATAESTESAADEIIAPAPMPCTKAPCAERPVIFIHGHNGGASDGDTLLDAFRAGGERFDARRYVGTEDHASWAARSIPRREWLFSFDYYVKRGDDRKGSYTAGAGRIGSDQSFSCANPNGKGHLVPTGNDYVKGVTHEFSADLAALVNDVLRATGARQVDIVAHSMGGLITRSYLTFLGGKPKVGNVLLLATPHEGVPFAVGESWFSDNPPWMTAHELTELNRFGLLAKSSFIVCGDNRERSFTEALTAAELATPNDGPPVHCMKGTKDLYVFGGSDKYERCVDYREVEGVDHPGLLKAKEATDRARALLGGTYLP